MKKYAPVKGEVWDKDTFSSDSMGEAYDDWQSCIDKPGISDT